MKKKKMLLGGLITLFMGVGTVNALEKAEGSSWVLASISSAAHGTMKLIDSGYRIKNAIQENTRELHTTLCENASQRGAIDLCNDKALLEDQAIPYNKRIYDASEELLRAALKLDCETITEIHQKTKGMKPHAIELFAENLCNYAEKSAAQKLETMGKTNKPATPFLPPEYRTDTLNDYHSKGQELAESADYVNKFLVATNELTKFMGSSKKHLSNLRHEAGTSQKRILSEVDTQLFELITTAVRLRTIIDIEALPHTEESVGHFLPADDTDSIYSLVDQDWPAPSTHQVIDLGTPPKAHSSGLSKEQLEEHQLFEQFKKFQLNNKNASSTVIPPRPGAPSMIDGPYASPSTIAGETSRRSSLPRKDRKSRGKSKKSHSRRSTKTYRSDPEEFALNEKIEVVNDDKESGEVNELSQ